MSQVPALEGESKKVASLTFSLASHVADKNDVNVHKQKLKALTAAICAKALRDAGFTNVENNTSDVHGKIIATTEIHSILVDMKKRAETHKGDDDSELTKTAFDVRINVGDKD